MNKKRIISAGTLVMDMIPEFYPEEGTGERKAAGGTVYLKNIRTALGGSVGNTGVALKYLGSDVTLFSRVGSDEFGVIVEKALKNTGCSYMVSESPDMHTSMSIVISYPHQDRMILHSRGASQRYGDTDIPEDLLNQNDMFHFGYPTGMTCMFEDSGETLSGIFQKVKQYGLTTSMDTSFPGVHTPAGKANWREILKKTLPYVDIFLPSFEEIYLMLYREEYLENMKTFPEMKMEQIFDIKLVQRIASELIKMGAGAVVIKCGEKGSYLKCADKKRIERFGKAVPEDTGAWDKKEIFTSPCKVNDIVSTNGAGDTFVAGFLNALLRGMAPEETINFASASAAYRISHENGLRDVTDWQDIEQKIILKLEKTQKENFEGWIYDEKYKILKIM